jgi:Domain of unknown function (DUF4907)
MKTLIILLVIVLNTYILQAQSRNSFPRKENKDSIMQAMAKIKAATSQEMQKANIQYFIIKAAENTYGYAIYIDGNMAIQQTTIPSLPGNVGFKDMQTAEKIATLVIKKIREGEMPPTLNADEVRAVVGK